MKRERNIERLFRPRHVAVVGASRNPAAIGGQPIAFLQKQNFPGQIFPVNPKYDEVAGLRCFADLAAIPEASDIVVVAVASRFVEDVIRAAGQRGCDFAIVFSAGYAETGRGGCKRQVQLAEVAREAGITLIGPNCQGIMNIAEGIHIGFGAPYGLSYRKGGFALTSQSGAFGNSLVMDLDSREIGFSRYISMGNEADLTTPECLEAFLGLEDVTAIGAYVEGLSNAGHFRRVARKAREKGKPILLWKVGTSIAGARAAAAHTANLRAETDFPPDAFRSDGVIDVRNARDMAICLKALQACPLPQARRVGAVTVSGGAGITVADCCENAGLQIGDLAEATMDRMRSHLPEFASLRNPVDVTGSAANDPESLAAALSAVVEDPKVDSLILALAAITGNGAKIAAHEIARIRETSHKPVVVSWNGPRELSGEAFAILEDAGIPIYKAPDEAVRAIEALCIFAGIAEAVPCRG